MVGVAGRSKACHTCKQRRIRCGSEQPRCSNCTKSGRFCAGYQHGHAFVLAKQMSTEVAAVNVVQSSSSSQVAYVTRWRKTKTVPSRASVAAHIARNERNIVKEEHQNERLHLPLPLPQHVSPIHADRDQFLHVFLHVYLPRSAQPDLSASVSHTSSSSASNPPKTSNFLLLLPRLPDIAPALEYAMLALCANMVAAVHGRPDLACRGRDLYARALHNLRLAVLDPNARLADQTLAATLLLVMYEFNYGAEEINGFQAHLGGALTLLQLRGPAAHTTGLGHALLFAARKPALFRSLSLADQESSFLATHDWQSLPYDIIAKNPHDELCDVLEQIPGLLASIRIIKAEKRLPAILSRTLSAVQLARRIEDALAAWFARFDASISKSGPLMVPKLARIPSTTDDPVLGKLYPVAFHFSHFAIGQAMALYWAGLVILYTFLSNAEKQLGRLAHAVATLPVDVAPCTCGRRNDDSIESGVEKAGPRCVRHFRLNSLQPRRPTPSPTPQAVADQVCQSVEFFLQDDMGLLGGTLIFPPLLIVRNARSLWDGDKSPESHYSRQGIWINEMMQRIAKGNQMAGQAG